MPDLTSMEAASGFNGLTVVFATRNEMTPATAVPTPTTEKASAIALRAGTLKPAVGAAREPNHMSAAMKTKTTSGGIFSSRECTSLLLGRSGKRNLTTHRAE